MSPYYRVFYNIIGGRVLPWIKNRQKIQFPSVQVEQAYNMHICHLFYILLWTMAFVLLFKKFLIIPLAVMIIYGVYFFFWCSHHHVDVANSVMENKKEASIKKSKPGQGDQA